ncbi:FMN-binding negative transcriptional regulator [Ferrimonas pelagia]|uniref:FMN-binding negative transcriptional regulator n=1 Tax=Ferrimonas pelagia TaxID=1177826 RepID=A0ABP9EVW5_9GAMM
MYNPKSFSMPDLASAHRFIQTFGFAVVIDPTLGASHLPLTLRSGEGELGTLYGHMARANPQWRELEGSEVLVVFSGPHSYISPSWYQTRPMVPTWNYAAVHVKGRVRLTSNAETVAALDTLLAQHESSLLQSNEIITDEIRQRLLGAIVGFSIEIEQIEGKQKLGQQRSVADQRGTYAGLAASKGLEAQALAAYMRSLGIGVSSD